MIKNKLSKLTICILLMISIFCFIPATYAEPGKWPAYLSRKPGYSPYSDPPGYHIGAWWWPFIGPEGHWEVPAGEYCFFRTGWIVSDYEIEAGYDPGPPYQNKLFINGEKIVMQRWTWTIPKTISLYPDGVFRTVNLRAWMWVVRFEPGYFEAGKSYKIQQQFLVLKPYQESDILGWRFYVNYMTGGAIPPADFTWEDWYGEAGVINNQFHWLDVV